MHGPRLLAASMIPRSGEGKPFKHGNKWQYHSRSDHHSKVACWGFLLDLMVECPLLRDHAAQGLIGYGLNHEMRDFKTTRKKNLDLVICRPRSEPSPKKTPSFGEVGKALGIALDTDAQKALDALPILRQLPVGSIHMALEAKACMTAHLKARPRLYDELNSSHQATHGNSPHAIAVGLALVNVAPTFISPGLNDFDLSSRYPFISAHNQPRDAAAVVEKLREIPRRSKDSEDGFDALAITVIDCKNNGSAVEVISTFPAPPVGDVYHYEMTVHRIAQLYEQKFKAIS